MIEMQLYHGLFSSSEDDGNFILQIVVLTNHSENEKDGVAFITVVSYRFWSKSFVSIAIYPSFVGERNNLSLNISSKRFSANCLQIVFR